ncbi:MAG TPA: hypothetical protein VFI25_20050 [Planctomycetota bacterium]|jgi:signal transduction histidine kinase|nr:hypothetical protein [Planctomycetota bacterium]
MSGPLRLSPPGGIAELPLFLRRLATDSAWAPTPGREWDFLGTANAPLRSLAARLASRGERVPALEGVEGPILALGDVEPLARRIGERAAALLPGFPPSLLRSLRFATRELAANVAEHARAGTTGFASVAPEGAGLAVWVSDCGIGIERSVRANPEVAGRVTDTAGAIALALQREIGEEGAPGTAGTGLPFVSEFCRAAGGEFAIVTGGIAWRRRLGAGGAYPSIVEGVDPWEGTIVAFRVPAPGSGAPAEERR